MDEGKKILVVDDDSDAVEAIKIILESKNYQVIIASDAEEGIERVKQDKPDLIILDVMMTKADAGFQVCWKLKHDEATSAIPILMLTAVEQRTGFKFSPQTDGDWLPADDYATKPLQPADLVSRVEELLKEKE